MVNLKREAIKTLINRHATYKSRNPQIERQILIDTERDHYQLLTIGWQNDKRIYHCSIHLDIKDEPSSYASFNRYVNTDRTRFLNFMSYSGFYPMVLFILNKNKSIEIYHLAEIKSA